QGEKLERLVGEFFSLQEGKLLLQGEEKLGRLHEFHDQIEILRGAAFNGAILFTLSLFGICSLYRARATGKLRIFLKYLTYVPALVCLLVGLRAMNNHMLRFKASQSAIVVTSQSATSTPTPTYNPYEAHRDPPIVEMVMILLGIGGIFLHLI